MTSTKLSIRCWNINWQNWSDNWSSWLRKTLLSRCILRPRPQHRGFQCHQVGRLIIHLILGTKLVYSILDNLSTRHHGIHGHLWECPLDLLHRLCHSHKHLGRHIHSRPHSINNRLEYQMSQITVLLQQGPPLLLLIQWCHLTRAQIRSMDHSKPTQIWLLNQWLVQ